MMDEEGQMGQMGQVVKLVCPMDARYARWRWIGNGCETNEY